MFIYATLLHSKCDFYVQHVNTPTVTILPTALGIYRSLNCFSHMIYVLQTSIYQNIVKLLTCPHNSLKSFLAFFFFFFLIFYFIFLLSKWQRHGKKYHLKNNFMRKKCLKPLWLQKFKIK